MLIFVIGAPGAGKGTLCARLAATYGFHHLSVGDVLRRLTAAERNYPDVRVVDCVRRGELIPAEALGVILRREIEEIPCRAGEVLVLDGFPRRLDQVGVVKDMIGSPDLVLFFNCPRELAKQRLVTRSIRGRNDTEEVFEKRYREFERLNGEIVEWYRRKGILREIDTSGETEVSWGKLVDVLWEVKVIQNS